MEDDEEDEDFFAIPSRPVVFGASLQTTEEDMKIHKKLCQEVGSLDSHEVNENNDDIFNSNDPHRKPQRQRKRSSNMRDVENIDVKNKISPKDEKKSTNRISLSSSSEEDEDILLSPLCSHAPPPPDIESLRLLQAADFALYNLKHKSQASRYNTSYSSSDFLDDSITEVSRTCDITLRVRCKGKVHKLTIEKTDPLLLIVSQLAHTLDTNSSQVILQYKSNDLDVNCSPHQLGITSVDILDAFILEPVAAATVSSTLPSTGGKSSFSIKLQAPNKSITYHIDPEESLEPTLKKFVTELGLTLKDVTFSFDGDKISKDQTPSDLDMEKDDVIDMWIINQKKR